MIENSDIPTYAIDVSGEGLGSCGFTFVPNDDSDEIILNRNTLPQVSGIKLPFGKNI